MVLQVDVCTIAPNDLTAYDSDTSEDMRTALRTIPLTLDPIPVVPPVETGGKVKGKSDPAGQAAGGKRPKLM